MAQEKSKRAPPLLEMDRMFLVQLVAEHKQILLDNDMKAGANRRKQDAWKAVSN